jgi:hypothetical protein
VVEQLVMATNSPAAQQYKDTPIHGKPISTKSYKYSTNILHITTIDNTIQ